MDNLRYWLGFNLVRGIGPVRLRALLESFGNVKAAWEAPEADLCLVGLDQRSLKNLVLARRQVDLEQLQQKVAAAGITALTWDDPAYPTLLRQISDAPPVLYVKGNLTVADEWAVALVGTRKPTPYGREVARLMASELVSNGVTVVSGLARGVDGIAHQAALDAGGRTLAVLGSGLDQIYPHEHSALAERIAAQGALLSDYPLGTRPEAMNFPPRNRIISGLSLGVVVVEAALSSGALITADFAADHGREVFAVPGSILGASSAGCNRLLRDGAHVVTEVGDILETLRLDQLASKQQVREVLPANPTEARVLAQLSAEPCYVDDLARSVGLPMEAVTSTLVMLELKGMVRQVGMLQYVVARESEEPYSVE